MHSPPVPDELVRPVSRGFGGGRAQQVAPALLPSCQQVRHVLGVLGVLRALRVLLGAWAWHRGPTWIHPTAPESLSAPFPACLVEGGSIRQLQPSCPPAEPGRFTAGSYSPHGPGAPEVVGVISRVSGAGTLWQVAPAFLPMGATLAAGAPGGRQGHCGIRARSCLPVDAKGGQQLLYQPPQPGVPWSRPSATTLRHDPPHPRPSLLPPTPPKHTATGPTRKPLSVCYRSFWRGAYPPFSPEKAADAPRGRPRACHEPAQRQAPSSKCACLGGAVTGA